ncbi:TFIIH C1-like domain containing protein [Fagus crenata]
MAMVATTAAPPQAPPPTSLLNQDSLSHIDISTLSQSELHALSLCSPSPSAFHQFARSRRQIYFRPSNSNPSVGLLPADNPKLIGNCHMGFCFDLTLTLPSISSIFIGEAKSLQNDREETHEG